ncbi:MAG: DUF4258 domain-containing protein [Caldilinea sp. CFX5]|nr:DUF4258 domain-containing protein [Caldilinea sp. CFX5]
MNRYSLTSHALEMIQERRLSIEWIWRTVDFPDLVEVGDDDNRHYMKAIPEKGGRILHVVTNEHVAPNRIITIFFDSRLRRKWQR